jgi:hypothetical protein
MGSQRWRKKEEAAQRQLRVAAGRPPPRRTVGRLRVADVEQRRLERRLVLHGHGRTEAQHGIEVGGADALELVRDVVQALRRRRGGEREHGEGARHSWRAKG